MKETNNIEIILAQWQTCVDMANATSQRRDSMNNIFVTLNIGIIAAISLIWDIKSLILSIAGIVICIVWLLFIKNYKELNSEKFKVINEIEKQLPIQAFNKEWKSIKANKKYRESTKLEIAFPIIFGFLYVIIAIIIISTKCC